MVPRCTPKREYKDPHLWRVYGWTNLFTLCGRIKWGQLAACVHNEAKLWRSWPLRQIDVSLAPCSLYRDPHSVNTWCERDARGGRRPATRPCDGLRASFNLKLLNMLLYSPRLETGSQEEPSVELYTMPQNECCNNFDQSFHDSIRILRNRAKTT